MGVGDSVRVNHHTKAPLAALLVAACSSTVTTSAPEVPRVDAAVEERGSRDAEAATAMTDGSDVFRCEAPDVAPPAIDAPPDAPPFVVEIASAAQLHTCARMSDGTLRCKGDNRRGVLGVPGVEVAERPVTVPGLVDVEQVVTSNLGATCTRHRDGRVRCWGSNRYALLGTGRVGDERCEGEPCRRAPTLVDRLDGVVHLAAGALDSMCAVRDDGTVWCWGTGGFPEALDDAARPTRLSNLRDVVWLQSTVPGWIMRLRDGSYRTTNNLRIEIPAEASLNVDSPSFHVCHRLPDTSARCAGSNARGQLGVGAAWPDRNDLTAYPPPLCGVRAMHTGAHHSCALMLAGDVWCWGEGRGGIGAPATEDCGACATRPQRVSGIDRVTALFLGVWSTWAIREDRTVWVWPDANGTDRPTRVEW